MRARNPVPFFLALGALALIAAAPVPRTSPDLTYTEPSGKPAQLSSFKGKVVVIEFLLTRCPHCWRVAQTITKLHKELGPRGFQPLGIAFDNGIGGPVVKDFAGPAGVTFPVGFTTADQVDRYLGREAQERVQVPQLVVVDRAGTLRAQSRPTGETSLEDAAYLRDLIDRLLKESVPGGSSKSPGR